MEPTKVQKIIARINQLRAISTSTHSQHEAETTASLASKLIAEYQLAEVDLEIASGTKTEEYDVTTEYVIYETGRSTPWMVSLCFGLADLHNLYAYQTDIRHGITHKRGKRYRILGRPSDIALCQYCFDYLVSTIKFLVDYNVPSTNKRGVSPERESWCLGAVHGFLNKMRAEKKAVMQQASSTAMVLVSNRVLEIKNAWRIKNPSMTMRTMAASKAQHVSNTYRAGYEKGQTLTVNSGLNGNKEPKRID